MKRLFIGVPLSDEIKRKVLPVMEELKQSGADLKMVAPENLHLTVAFLGNLPEDRIKDIVSALENALRGIRPFTLQLKGIGSFPSSGRINSLWVGAPSPEFASVIRRVGKVLMVQGGHQEEVPHATLARVKSGRNKETLQKLLEKHQETEFGEMKVEKVVLYESELRKEGPVYWVVKEFTLT